MAQHITLIEITQEEELGNDCIADLDSDGELTIIQDESIPEDKQVYVHLNATQVEILKQMLAR